jgi:arylsulfatase A-like enzyme
LNWLCATGIRYARCYADGPICGRSRATIMTGVHAHTHGQVNNVNEASPMVKLLSLVWRI